MGDGSTEDGQGKLYHRIGELAALLSVEPHVLRYWEQEFQIRPARSPSGQRMYAKKDLDRFLQVKSLLYDKGYTIAGARKALKDGGDETDGLGGETQVREALELVRATRLAIARARTELCGPLREGGH